MADSGRSRTNNNKSLDSRNVGDSTMLMKLTLVDFGCVVIISALPLLLATSGKLWSRIRWALFLAQCKVGERKVLIHNPLLFTFSECMEAVTRMKDIGNLEIVAKNMDQLQSIGAGLKPQSVDILQVRVNIPGISSADIGAFVSLVRIPRSRLEMVFDTDRFGDELFTPNLLQAIDQQLLQHDLDGLSRPEIELENAVLDYRSPSTNIPDTATTLGLYLGDNIDMVTFLTVLADLLRRTKKLKCLKIDANARFDNMSNSVPSSVVQKFQDSLEANSTLKSLFLNGFGFDFNFLVRCVFPALHKNRSVKILTVGMIGDGLIPDITRSLPFMKGLNVLDVWIANAQAFPPCFHSAVWQNEALLHIAIHSYFPGVRFGSEPVLRYPRLVLRNMLFNGAREVISTPSRDEDEDFLEALATINCFTDDPSDIHDVTISALYELTRKFGPHVIESFKMTSNRSQKKSGAQKIRRIKTTLNRSRKECSKSEMWPFGLAALTAFSAIVLTFDPRI